SILLGALPVPPVSPLFPYTTLFRSAHALGGAEEQRVAQVVDLVRADRRRREVLLVPGEVGRRGGEEGDARARERDLGRAREHQRSEEHTSELQSRENLVCRLLLEKK